MFLLSKLDSLIDWGCRVIVKDKTTRKAILQSDYYDLKQTQLYRMNAKKTVKVCKCTLPNTYVIYL